MDLSSPEMGDAVVHAVPLEIARSALVIATSEGKSGRPFVDATAVRAGQ